MSLDSRPLEGQTALVTGGSGALGRALVCALAEHGANVALCGRTLATATRAAETLPAPFHSQLMPMACDLQEASSMVAAREQVRAAWGPIDIFVNAAGGNLAEASTGPGRGFFDLDPEALREVMELNFVAAVYATQIFARDMAERGKGNIVHIASMAGVRPLTRVAGYSAAKAALANFTQWLAVHVSQHYGPNVRVNAIAPGFFLTEQNRFLLFDGDQPTARAESILAHTPQQRFGSPEDLKSALQWLVSPQSSFVTGVVLPVDGGFSAFAGV